MAGVLKRTVSTRRSARNEFLQMASLFGVAGLLGLLGGGLSATGRPELMAIAVGLLAAVMMLSSRVALFWFVIVGALVVVGTMQLYLPGARYVRYVIPLASVGLVLHWVFEYVVRDRKNPVKVPPIIWWAASFALVGLLSSVINLSEPATSLMGMKDYFQMWAFFLSCAFLRWKPSFVDKWPRWFVAVALLQLPFAVHQYLVLVPKRLHLGEGIVAVDVIAGTFGAELFGGGANAVLAAFLIIVIGGILAMWRTGVLTGYKAFGLSILVISPLLVNEAKIALLYFPLVFVVICYEDAVRRPIWFLRAGAIVSLALAALLTFVTLTHPSGKLKSWSDLTNLVVSQQTGSLAEQRLKQGEFTRWTVLTFWAKEHSNANLANVLIGHGLGSSRAREGGLGIAETLAETRYQGLQIGYTGLSSLLWDTGIVGVVCVFGMFISAFRSAGRLARRYESSDRYRSATYSALQAGMAVLMLSLVHKDFFVVHLPFQTLTYWCIGWIAWACTQNNHEADNLRGKKY